MTDKITETHSLTLTRYAKRARSEAIESQITGLISSVCPRSLEIEGWKVTRELDSTFIDESITGEEFSHKFIVPLTVTYDSNTPPNTTFDSLALAVFRKAAMPRFGQWTLTQTDGEDYQEPSADVAIAKVGENVAYEEVTMPEDFWSHFSHLYGLDAQIGMLQAAIEAAIESEFADRFHCAFIGPPGCGKTDIGRAVKAMYGEQVVWEFDATATTAAGIIKELSEAPTLPRFIVIEEGEKAPEASLQPLLALLDKRSEVRKVTARKKVQREIAVLVIMTVNNEDKFRALQAGALYSRFMNKIHFGEPDWDTIRMILQREIRKLANGDMAWITPTIEYCQKANIRDPRQIISICLCGRKKLLTGEYQKMLQATSAEHYASRESDTFEMSMERKTAELQPKPE